MSENQNIISENLNRNNKILIGVIAAHLILVLIYFSMAFFFRTHFYFGSSINSVDISGKTIREAEELLSAQPAYALELDERGGKKEYIKASDIDFKYNSGDIVNNVKNAQNPLGWVYALIDRKNSVITVSGTFNEELLKKYFNNLSCFTGSDIIKPQNPSFKYTDKGYETIDKIDGNTVNKDVLYSKVIKAISNGDRNINLESANCYIKPQYDTSSPKVIDVRDSLNKYISAKITYNFGDKKQLIDGSLINTWLQVDNNMEIQFDENKIRTDLDNAFSSYETVGKTRNFVTSTGKTIKISGGDYGWSINTTKEIEDVIAAVKEGQTVEKEPTYIQTAASHSENDIGNTYVEVDISSQHIWYYKNGSLIVQGDVVTGNISQNHGTRTGVFYLKYKDTNATLKGEDYSVPVSYWMPFSGGMGIHDASWRSSFGGSIYITNGSHGCVNAPYYVAEAIYKNIEKGAPIIVY